jgi:hypothetical protein
VYKLNIEVKSKGVAFHNTRGGGSFEVRWTISSNVPSARINGFIIQHVKILGEAYDAKGAQVPLVAPKLNLWEAWEVVNGEVHANLPKYNKLTGPQQALVFNEDTDQFKMPIETAGTKGHVLVSGEVVFIPYYAMDPADKWSRTAFPETGGLPATATKPKGWDEASKNARLHTLFIAWDDITPQTTRVFTNP